MTGTELITKFNSFVDDSLDSTLALQLVNDSMHEIEEEVTPEGIKKVDTSDSTTVGQTYTTAIALPDDFFQPLDCIFVGTELYTQISFEQATYYRDLPGHFYIDHANGNYHLTGTQGSVQTISFPYYYATPDLTLATEPTWPDRFHSLIPLKMAQIYFAIDAGDKQRAWDDRWAAMYDQRLKKFKDYDAALKLAAIDHSLLGPGAHTSENRVNDI